MKIGKRWCGKSGVSFIVFQCVLAEYSPDKMCVRKPMQIWQRFHLLWSCVNGSRVTHGIELRILEVKFLWLGGAICTGHSNIGVALLYPPVSLYHLVPGDCSHLLLFAVLGIHGLSKYKLNKPCILFLIFIPSVKYWRLTKQEIQWVN